MDWSVVPGVIAAVGTLLTVAVTLVLGLRKQHAERRVSDDEVGDKLRDDLIVLFEVQNKRLAEQDARLLHQQEIIDKLQALVDTLRENNRVLQAEKHTLELQNVELQRKLEAWERLRKTVVTEKGDEK